jgi:hypothetical protein
VQMQTLAPMPMQAVAPVQMQAVAPVPMQAVAPVPMQAVAPVPMQSLAAIQTVAPPAFGAQQAVLPMQSYAVPAATPVLAGAQATAVPVAPQAADFRAAAQFISKLADSIAAAQAAEKPPAASAQAISQDCCERLTREVGSIRDRLDRVESIILRLEPFLNEPRKK